MKCSSNGDEATRGEMHILPTKRCATALTDHFGNAGEQRPDCMAEESKLRCSGGAAATLRLAILVYQAFLACAACS